MLVADTIVAIATAPGEAGVGVIRLSGPEALAVGLTAFDWRRSQHPEARRVYHGILYRPGTRERMDDGLLTYFQAPHSYTGEDTVELSCHGSDVVLRALVRGFLQQGARLAEPGEFTRRAFLNGKLDLAEAESVIQLIQARSEAALKVATNQRSGRLSREIGMLRESLIAILAEIEAGIDFPDEIDPPPDAEVAARAAAVRARTEELLQTADAGRLYREGAALVLAGRPNVGKSSLLNALLGEARAIVTEIAGTTRDTIEEALTIEGVPVRVIDTAGLRSSLNLVEQLGIERAKAQVAAADLVLWVIDSDAGVTEDDLELALELPPGLKVLLVANKADLAPIPDAGALPFGEALAVSAVTGVGMEALRTAIAAELTRGRPAPEQVWINNARQESRLRATLTALDDAIAAAEAGFDQAAIALDLRLAAEALGEITGETVTEDTITQIFARFCVGK